MAKDIWDKEVVTNMVKMSKMKLLVVMEVCATLGFILGLLAARTMWQLWHVVSG